MENRKLLKGKQICPATDVSRKIDAITKQLDALQDDLMKHQLVEDYTLLVSATESLASVASSLERKAREAFVAARRGEELPK